MLLSSRLREADQILHLDLGLVIVVLQVISLIVFKFVHVELIKRYERCVFSKEYPTFYPPWERLGNLVLHEDPSRHSEDVVELFESSLLRFWKPQENHDECQNIEACVLLSRGGPRALHVLC